MSRVHLNNLRPNIHSKEMKMLQNSNKSYYHNLPTILYKYVPNYYVRISFKSLKGMEYSDVLHFINSLLYNMVHKLYLMIYKNKADCIQDARTYMKLFL